MHIQNPVYYRKFRHIQAYLRPVQRYSGKLWHIYNPLQLLHIQNPAIFRMQAYLEPKIYANFCQGIFWHIQNARILRTLPYSELGHIQDRVIFRILFIQAQIYSIMIVIITLTFFHFDHTFFSTKFKKICFLTAITSISMLDWAYLNNTP